MNHKNGFTLIELSIVLVIIGLIVGGILTGQELIRTAQLRTIVSQKTQYSAAFNAFRNKYGCLPGDCTNATQFFGAAGGSAADNYTNSCFNFNNNNSPNPATCNGNGDGMICDGAATGAYYDAMACNEQLSAWQQLAGAGLIEGIYSPYYSMGNGSVYPWEVISGNIPVSKAQPNAGFSIIYICGMNNGYFFLNNWCGHTFIYGAQDINSGGGNYTGEAVYPVLTVIDAYRIDAKIDDGLPGTGNVTTFTNDILHDWTLSACSTTSGSTVTSATQYPITGVNANLPSCALMFKADGF